MHPARLGLAEVQRSGHVDWCGLYCSCACAPTGPLTGFACGRMGEGRGAHAVLGTPGFEGGQWLCPGDSTACALGCVWAGCELHTAGRPPGIK